MTRDEFGEQMRPCLACGKPCDGDVCDDYCADDLRARQQWMDAHDPQPELSEEDA